MIFIFEFNELHFSVNFLFTSPLGATTIFYILLRLCFLLQELVSNEKTLYNKELKIVTTFN